MGGSALEIVSRSELLPQNVKCSLLLLRIWQTAENIKTIIQSTFYFMEKTIPTYPSMRGVSDISFRALVTNGSLAKVAVQEVRHSAKYTAEITLDSIS